MKWTRCDIPPARHRRGRRSVKNSDAGTEPRPGSSKKCSARPSSSSSKARVSADAPSSQRRAAAACLFTLSIKVPQTRCEPVTRQRACSVFARTNHHDAAPVSAASSNANARVSAPGAATKGDGASPPTSNNLGA